MFVPTLSDGPIVIRPIRVRDAKALERELMENRGWLRKWEATNPNGPMSFDTRASIRSLQNNARAGYGLPFLIEYEGRLALPAERIVDQLRLGVVGQYRLLGLRAVRG